ncbi:Ulp1 family isopeptidase [Chlamydia sp. 12-01]|uniref:Ulp1 family isopeptidase n=1 Tax=Chlamydia sp. 12-01 TaxID=3002742 RepID=UPI0035D47B6B
MANFLLSPPNTQPGSIYTLYNPSPLLPKEKGIKSGDKKNPITGPGSFDNASFLSKLARVILAAILIIITLGLILCFVSIDNLSDLNFDETHSDHPKYSYSLHPPYEYDPTSFNVEPEIRFASWDGGQILTHFLRLSEKYPNLFVPSLVTISTYFSLERNIFSDLHLFNRDTRQFLDQPDLNQCHHTELTSYPHLEGKNCQNFRILAYPMWHHPMAETEDEMINRMLSTAQNGYAGISHWTSVIINLDTREILYFDSLAHFIPSATLDPVLNSIATRLGKHYPDNTKTSTPFTIKKIVRTAVQKDGSSCGIWTSLFLERYLENPDYVIPTMGYTETQNYVQAFLDTIPKRPLTQASQRTHNVLKLICINPSD